MSDDRWYAATDDPEVVEFGQVRGLGVTGQGAPGGQLHAESTGAVFAVAGQLLGMAAASGAGFGMPMLEGRWWVEEPGSPFDVPREKWWWHLFMRVPDRVFAAAGPEVADRAVQAARQTFPAAARVNSVAFVEGSCVQAMHHGSYADEPRTLACMEELISARGLVYNGLHHEIYLSDTRETDPARMRTILRQPVASALS